MFGTLICIPILYVPYLSDKVFKHTGGTWEWGMIAGLSVGFMMLCEVYKFFKRLFLPPLTTYVSETASPVSIKVDKAKSGMVPSESAASLTIAAR